MSNNVFPDTIDVNVVSPIPLPNNPMGDFGLNIQRGAIPNLSAVHKFGRNPLIDKDAGFEDLWNGGGKYTGFDATAAEIVEVFSSSGSDTSAGTGARTARLIGLGTGFVEQTEVITLNGTTPVNSTLSYIRLDRVIVLTAGSLGHNSGSITGRQSVTLANVFFVLAPETNRTLIACYTIPFGKVGYIVSGFASLAAKTDGFAEINALVRFPGSVFQVAEWFSIGANGTSYVLRDFKVPLAGIPTGTDVKIAANTSELNMAIAGGFELILEDL